MRSREFFNAAGMLDFNLVGGQAYGDINGYPLVLQQGGSKKLQVTVTLREAPDRTVMKMLRRAIKEERSHRDARGLETRILVRKNQLTAGVNLAHLTHPRQVPEALELLLEILKNNDCMPPDCCRICALSSPDSYMLLPGSGYDAVHRVCVDRLHTETAHQAQVNPGSYLTGAIGALIGAVIGALPSILLICTLGVISAWAFMLIPICTYYGYKLLRGKMTGAVTVISILFSFVGLAFVLFVWDIATNLIVYDFGLSAAIRLSAYYATVGFSLSYWSWLLADLFDILLFFVLGIVFSISIIRKNNRRDLVQLDRARATMRARINSGYRR